MNKKRFKLICEYHNEWIIQDMLQIPIHDKDIDNNLTLRDTVDLLNQLNDENEQLKIKADKKQKHIVLLEGKISRMREQIKKFEGLYHYCGWEGSGDMKKECYELQKQVESLKAQMNNWKQKYEDEKLS